MGLLSCSHGGLSRAEVYGIAYEVEGLNELRLLQACVTERYAATDCTFFSKDSRGAAARTFYWVSHREELENELRSEGLSRWMI